MKLTDSADLDSTVDCKYLFFLQGFFFRLKPKQYKDANIADCFKKIWKLIKTRSKGISNSKCDVGN